MRLSVPPSSPRHGHREPEDLAFDGPVLTLAELDRRYARWAIAQLGGRKMLTAEMLDVDRKTLARLLDDGED